MTPDVGFEEIETPDILHAWNLTLQLLEALGPTKIIAGRIEKGRSFDAQADLQHMHKYLGLFASKITSPPKKPTADDLFQTKGAFPQGEKNLDFFLGHLSNQYTYPV